MVQATMQASYTNHISRNIFALARGFWVEYFVILKVFLAFNIINSRSSVNNSQTIDILDRNDLISNTEN